MKTLIAILALSTLTAFGGCGTPTTPTVSSVVGATPEAQIKNGADASKAAATLAGVLLKRDVITVAQAKGFSTLLHAASDTLDTANATLLACRSTTGSKPDTVPDPCQLGIKDLIPLAVASINGVQAALAAKQ